MQAATRLPRLARRGLRAPARRRRAFAGHVPATRRACGAQTGSQQLPGIDPKAGGQPAYATYNGAKVDQQFNAGWGIGVVCCITADPHRKSMTRTPAPDAIYPTKSQPFSII